MAAIAIKSEAEWLSVRESFVGGSEIASLFYAYQLPDGSEVVRHAYEEQPLDATPLGCLSNFRSATGLYNEKAGLVMPEDFSSERVDAGRFIEPALAEWSKKKWGWPIRKVRRYLSHETVDGWGASLDYEIHGDGETGVPVEFKNIDWLVFQREWVCDGEEIIAPPLKYSLQLQHQMGGTGADHGWIVVCVGGNELKRGRIARHEPTQARIAEAVSAFWAGVRSETAPIAVADYGAVAKAFAEGDKALALDLTEDESFPDLCSRYVRRKADLDAIEKDVERLKGQIAIRLGEATKAKTRGYRLSWPVVRREAKLIPARQQEATTYRSGLTVTAIEEA